MQLAFRFLQELPKVGLFFFVVVDDNVPTSARTKESASGIEGLRRGISLCTCLADLAFFNIHKLLEIPSSLAGLRLSYSDAESLHVGVFTGVYRRSREFVVLLAIAVPLEDLRSSQRQFHSSITLHPHCPTTQQFYHYWHRRERLRHPYRLWQIQNRFWWDQVGIRKV